MKWNPHGYWLTIAVLVIIIFSLVQCEEDKTTVKDVTITIPPISGEIKVPSKSTEIPLSETDTIYAGGYPIYTPSPLDEELKAELFKAKDSIEKYKLFADAARKREYSEEFEDSLVKINVNTTVFGKLDKNEIKYTLKPRQVIVQEKTTVKVDKFGWLITGGYNHSFDPTINNNIEAGAGARFNKVSVIGKANTQKQIGINLIIEF